MVLWEVTLATAYFLGLKRTYRLALKIQRRAITLNHPKIRKFVHGRTRMVFDVALKVHRNVQERDLQVGRNVGNWILRLLDRMKPSANIRPSLPQQSNVISSNMNIMKRLRSLPKPPNFSQTWRNENNSGKHLFAASKAMWRSTSFPRVAMMMSRIPRPAGSIMKHLRSSYVPQPPATSSQTSRSEVPGKHLFAASKAMWRSTSFPTVAMMMRRIPRPAGTMTRYRQLSNYSNGYSNGRFEGVIRKDIMQWIQRA